MTTISFTWAISTPFRIGSGTGRPGGVDIEMLDPLSVSEDSVKGVILDAARTVARLRGWDVCGAPLQGRRTCGGTCVLCGVFGAPGWPPAAYSFSAARLQGSEGASAADLDRVGAASSLVTRHNRIDPATGTVERRALWSAEWGRAGKFVARIREREDRVLVDDSRRELERKLIGDSIKFVDAIGARRRRGAGRCRAESVELQTSDEIVESAAAHVWAEIPGTEFAETQIEAVLQAPLVSREGSGPGMFGGNRPLVSGAALLGAAAGIWARSNGVGRRNDNPAAWDLGGKAAEFDRLFRSGMVSWPFLSATHPGRLSERECKSLCGYRVDLLDSDDSVSCPRCGSPLEALKPRAGATPVTRTAIDPASRTAADAQLFTVVQQSPGSTLRGVLRCRTDLKDEVDKIFPPDRTTRVRLGADRSTKGEALIRRLPPDPAAPAPASQTLQFTLLSDAILPESAARFYTAFHPEWLAEVFGVDASHVTIDSQFASTRRVDGFSAARGLPSPSDIALVAGSCALVTLSAPPDTGALATLIALGVGIRRRQGFGRVALKEMQS